MAENQKILVIDDSNTNVVLLEAILGTKGYKIMTALSAKEAMGIIKKDRPHLILLDLLMPEISGFDFLEDIKHNERLSSIPVIVISALTDDVNIEKTKKMGAVEFIEKPVDIQTLVDTVETILKN
ncbi:MAG TPA: response regulator [Bacteroidales bacterium]|nr:response regulator [Bacteroidales bacterium]